MSGRLITVFGATGSQGNPIARALLAKGFKVRAVTRNPDNAKAQDLKAKGAEIVQVKNMDDSAALEGAIKGAYGVFLVTNYWGMLAENPSTAYDRELSQGKSVGDICKKLGVKHLVYSGLEYVKGILGKECPHYDSKGLVEKYLDEISVPNTSVRYAFYFDNFINNNTPPQKNDDGTYSLTLPMDGPLYGVSVEDAGPAVAAIFEQPAEFIGKKIGLSNEKLTLHEYTAIISKVTGKTLKYNQVPSEVFAKLPFPAADDVAVMFEFLASNPGYDVTSIYRLNPAALKFEKWAEQNKDKFPWPQ